MCLAVRALSGTTPPKTHGWLEEALVITRDGPMPYTRAWVMAAAGASWGERHLAGAIDLERAALEICRRFKAPESSVMNGVLTNLADHLLTMGNLDEARMLALESLRSTDRVGHRTWASANLELLGRIEAATGPAERAMVLIAASRVHEARLGSSALHYASDVQRLSETVGRLEAELGEDRARAARMRGEVMSYREAVAFAFGVGPPHRARRRGRRAVRAPAPA